MMFPKLFSAALCVLSLSSFNSTLSAHDSHDVELDWLYANATTGFLPATGETLSETALTPITFYSHHDEGKSIHDINPQNSKFRLKKGNYFVSFTGTFDGASRDFGQAFVEVGFNVDQDGSTPPKVYYLNEFAVYTDGPMVVTISGILKLDHNTTLEVVALSTVFLDSPDPVATVYNRNLSIIRLGD